MTRGKPVVHLVCNAHIDPIWMWHWEEGAREALSTFRVAADLLDEYPDFIFNHNESVLYEWIEQYDPMLFARIRKLVKEGRWQIAGGWYLQPDCNMPGGETFVRLIAIGLRYFFERFGVRPRIAYNFDPFGHNGSLPQLLKQSGFELYVHCRPGPKWLDLPAPLYCWKGLDGSEMLALRPITWYNSRAGKAVESAREGVEYARITGEDVVVLWGLGDHGGGATGRDLEMLRSLQEEVTDIELRHSTLEAYQDSLKQLPRPVHQGDLQRCFVGCYTSISPIKRGMRRGEALLRSAETWSALAWWRYGIKYPQRAVDEAWKGVLFNTFHDILPGSTMQAAVQDVMEIFGRSADTCRRLRLGAQLALLPQARLREGSIPVYIFNPHASPVTAPVGLEFLSSYLPSPSREPFALYDDHGRQVVAQDQGGPHEQSAGTWQRHLSFTAIVPALTARRYEIRMNEMPAECHNRLTVKENRPTIIVENRWMRASFRRSTGSLSSLMDKRTGRELLRGSVRPLAMWDSLDAWSALPSSFNGTSPSSTPSADWSAQGNANMSTPIGEFSPLAPEDAARWAGAEGGRQASISVLHQGPVSVTIQSIVGWRRSRVCQQITFFADVPWVDISLRVHWQERAQCLKYVFPFRLRSSKANCEVPFAAIERTADGTEWVGGRWVRLEETEGDRLGVGVANDGQYGFHARRNGELGLSLLRGAIHCRYGNETAFAEEHHNYMDQGEHDFRFRLLFGKASAVARALIPAAYELNLPLEAFFMCSSPTPLKKALDYRPPLLEISPNTVVMTALKKAETSEDLVFRVNETLGRRTLTTIRFEGVTPPVTFNLRPFEIRTFRVSRQRGQVKLESCPLLEDMGE